MKLINECFYVFHELMIVITEDTISGDGILITKPYMVHLEDKGMADALAPELKRDFEDLSYYINQKYEDFCNEAEEKPDWDKISIQNNAPEDFLNQDLDAVFFQTLAALIVFDFRRGAFLHAIECLHVVSENDENIINVVINMIRNDDFKDEFIQSVFMLAALALDIEGKSRIKNDFLDIRKRR